MIKNCLNCGKPFHVFKSRLIVGRGKYCSSKCYHAPKTLIERICIYCNKKFKIYKYNLKYGRGKFCSYPCFCKHNVGPNHQRWRGGRVKKSEYEGTKIRSGYYLLTHRVIMAKTLGRSLRKGEIVHHVNRKTLDNKPENLALCSNVGAHNWCKTEEAKIFFGG